MLWASYGAGGERFPSMPPKSEVAICGPPRLLATMQGSINTLGLVLALEET